MSTRGRGSGSGSSSDDESIDEAMHEFTLKPANIATYQPPMVFGRNANVLSSRWIEEIEGVIHTGPYPIEAKVQFALDLLHHAA